MVRKPKYDRFCKIEIINIDSIVALKKLGIISRHVLGRNHLDLECTKYRIPVAAIKSLYCGSTLVLSSSFMMINDAPFLRFYY